MTTLTITAEHHLLIDGIKQPGHLTRTEVRTLIGIFSSKVAYNLDQFLNNYAEADEPDDNLFKVYIYKIRSKLGEHKRAIKTVWGKGYISHPDYTLSLVEAGFVNVPVPAAMLAELAFYDRSSPQDFITKMLRKHIDAEKLKPHAKL